MYALKLKHEVTAISQDISSASDFVFALLYKLSTNGIQSSLLDLMSDFIHCFKSQVALDGALSHGILGAILLLVCINDTSSSLENVSYHLKRKN